MDDRLVDNDMDLSISILENINRLSTLPYDIFGYIFSYVDVKQIYLNLIELSSHYNNVLTLKRNIIYASKLYVNSKLCTFIKNNNVNLLYLVSLEVNNMLLDTSCSNFLSNFIKLKYLSFVNCKLEGNFKLHNISIETLYLDTCIVDPEITISLDFLPINLIQLIIESTDVRNGFNFENSSITYFSCSQGLLSLHNLPPFLSLLEVQSCHLKNLPTLPDSLIDLNCTDNNIIEICNLPLNLMYLNVSFNSGIKLPILPLHLHSLNYSSTYSSSIAVNLPKSLEILDCSINELTTLPNILHLENLKVLICSSNHLEIFDFELPSSLEVLDCSHNNIKSFKSYLPINLKELLCSFNQLRQFILPLPGQLILLDVSYNPDLDRDMLEDVPHVNIICK